MGLLDRVGRKLEGSKLARIIRQAHQRFRHKEEEDGRDVVEEDDDDSVVGEAEHIDYELCRCHCHKTQPHAPLRSARHPSTEHRPLLPRHPHHHHQQQQQQHCQDKPLLTRLDHLPLPPVQHSRPPRRDCAKVMSALGCIKPQASPACIPPSVLQPEQQHEQPQQRRRQATSSAPTLLSRSLRNKLDALRRPRSTPRPAAAQPALPPVINPSPLSSSPLSSVPSSSASTSSASTTTAEPAATTALEYCIQESSKYHITTVSHKTRSYLRIKYTDYNSVASTRAHNHPPPSIFVRLPVTANCVL